MMIFERDIAIDLGTSNLLIYVRGKGITLREPSIVAVDKYTGRMLKVGQEAQKMLGRTPANIVAIHPVNAGVISDYDMTAAMLHELLGVRPVRTLRKVRNAPPQSLAGNAEKRRENITGAYTVWKPARFQGKRVLIIDDIITTGSTVSECARMLGKAGANQVLCATVARSRS